MQISKWVALGVAAFCLVAVGGVVNMPHLYYMAAMLVTLPVVSYFLGWYMLRGLVFTRFAPSPVWEGEETDVLYKAHNASKVSRFFISIQEPVDAHTNSLEMNPPLFNVKPGSTIEVRNRVRFDRRGVFQAGSFDVAAIDPLGVFTFTRTISSSDETVVYPMPRDMTAMNLHGAVKQGWNETPVFARHGDGVDTSGVRGYLPGDPLRRIHWRQTARTGELTVIEFEETQSANIRIVLDSMSDYVVGEEPNTSLEYSIRVAASIARDAIQSGSSVDLVIANSDGANRVPAWNGLNGERGDSQLYSMMDLLARVQPQSTTSMSELLASTIGTVPRGTTIVAICLNPDKELAAVLARCAATGIVATIIYINLSSFPGAQTRSGLTGGIRSVAEIAAMGIPVFAVSWSSDGVLAAIPVDERVSYV